MPIPALTARPKENHGQISRVANCAGALESASCGRLLRAKAQAGRLFECCAQTARLRSASSPLSPASCSRKTPSPAVGGPQPVSSREGVMLATASGRAIIGAARDSLLNASRISIWPTAPKNPEVGLGAGSHFGRRIVCILLEPSPCPIPAPARFDSPGARQLR